MKQDYRRIEELIESFFEGQTSNEDERELYAFFSGENVPEHLLPYCPVFEYFETGIKEEEHNNQIINLKNIKSTLNKKITIWAGIAASLLLLISFGIHHFVQEKEFNSYEGSYIIRNGIKITDLKIVVPEIKKTLYLVQQQEEEYEQLLQQLQGVNFEDPYEQIMEEIRQQQLNWVKQEKDENIRNELLEIFNLKL